jgi:hypothetical protein
VGHNPKAAPGGVPAPRTAGVYDNDITGNDITGNGTAGQGAGVVLATACQAGPSTTTPSLVRAYLDTGAMDYALLLPGHAAIATLIW